MRPGAAPWQSAPMYAPGHSMYPLPLGPTPCSDPCAASCQDLECSAPGGTLGGAWVQPSWPGQVQGFGSLRARGGGSTNGRQNVTCPRRYTGQFISPLISRGPMNMEGSSFVPQPSSNCGQRICCPWSRVPVKNCRSSPWSGVTPATISHPLAQCATPRYSGPLAHLVEYDSLGSNRLNPERPALQLKGLLDPRSGERRHHQVPVRPRCTLKRILKPSHVPPLAHSTL